MSKPAYDSDSDDLVLGADDETLAAMALDPTEREGELDAMLRRLDALTGILHDDSSPQKPAVVAATDEGAPRRAAGGRTACLSKTLQQMSSSLAVALVAAGVSIWLLVWAGSSHSIVYLAGVTAGVLGMLWTTRFLLQGRRFERAVEGADR